MSHGEFLGRSNLGDMTFLASQEDDGGFAQNEGVSSVNYFGNISRSFNGKGFWGVDTAIMRIQQVNRGDPGSV